MAIGLHIQSAGPDAPAHCGPILRSIPEWFGIEEATAAYIAATATKPIWIAWLGDAAAGFVSITRHFPGAAEVHCIAVHKDCHGRGLGTALVRHVEAPLRDDGVRYLQVKTMGPSKPNREYAMTLHFYESRGFERIEVRDVSPSLTVGLPMAQLHHVHATSPSLTLGFPLAVCRMLA